jgi:NADPH:quinone reductase-like Zn-dependent oxidoreductase
MGQINLDKLGDECSGIVSRVGASVQNVAIGDRVVAPAPGAFSTFVRRAALGVEKIPENMTFEEAAALPIVFCTALQSIKVANLQRGETVLIHAASGGLGQALIQLCKLYDAHIFATVGSKQKKDFLMETYGIPAQQIFYSRDSSFAEHLLLETNGRGVDVIFNSLSSDLLRCTWRCIASFGRFIELGKRDFQVNSRLEMSPFQKNASFSAVDILQVLYERPEYGAGLWREVMSLVASGNVKPPAPMTVYPMSEIENAMRSMQSGKNIGKIVLQRDLVGQAKVSTSSYSTPLCR